MIPSLAPTALLFFETPLRAQASPCNTIIGHLVGIVTGVGALAAFGLLDAPSVLQEGVTFPRIGAAAASLSAAGAITLVLRSQQPPAGATTLVVSLGMLTTGTQLLSIAIGILLLTAVCSAINRALGVPVPLWSERQDR